MSSTGRNDALLPSNKRTERTLPSTLSLPAVHCDTRGTPTSSEQLRGSALTLQQFCDILREETMEEAQVLANTRGKRSRSGIVVMFRQGHDRAVRNGSKMNMCMGMSMSMGIN